MQSEFAAYTEESALGKPYDIHLLKRLFPFVRPYRWFIFWSVLLAVCISGLDIALPYITKVAIDRYIVPRANEETEEKVRYLTVNPEDPAVAALIRKYPDLFEETKDNAVRAALSDLGRLDREEIRTLRREDLEGVTLVAAAFLMIIICHFVLTYLQMVVMERAGQGIMHDLRMRLFSHLQGLAVSFFNRNPLGRLVTRSTNDIQNMYELFTSIIVFLFKDLFMLIGITVVLISLDWRITLVCYTVMPIVLAASLYFSRRVREVFRILRIKTAEINTRFSETIGGIGVIQVFRQEQKNYRRFRRLNHEFYQAGMRQVHIYALFMPMIDLASALALGLVLYYGGGGVLAEQVSLGVLVAFISYMRMFFQPIRDLSEKYSILQNAMSSAERIFLLLDTKEQLPVPASGDHPAPLGRIEILGVENVSLSYVKNEPVLKGISFSVSAGETVAVVGPTGSGKTSLINLMIRFYDPTAGRITLNGQDIRNWPPSDIRSHMALVTQDPFLFSETVRENIVQGNGRFSDADMERILDMSNCRSLVERLPKGLETRLSEGGMSISSGERQLISIARAFARDPEVIILDEATSYIDSEAEARIQDALANLMQGRTAILVAHRLSTARGADKIIVLYQGRILEMGNHAELMAQKGFYYRLNQLQRVSEIAAQA